MSNKIGRVTGGTIKPSLITISNSSLEDITLKQLWKKKKKYQKYQWKKSHKKE